MLVLGFHAAPWVLIGLSPAIVLLASLLLSRLKPQLIIVALLIITTSNFTSLKESLGKGQPLLSPDTSAIVSRQLMAIDYTYQRAKKEAFGVNSVTNPLYVNAVWAWNYKWYGEKKYGFLPSFLGGDQEAPYDLLPKPSGQEKLFFVIKDTSPRIPEVHRILAQEWAEEHAKFIEEKDFEGISVSMWEVFKPF